MRTRAEGRSASRLAKRRRQPPGLDARAPQATSPSSFIRTLSIPTPFPVGPVNVHVILRDPITLIDSGPLTEEAWDALEAGLRRLGLEVSDVKRVLLTHGHQDHFGLAEKIADASGATLYGGKLDRRNFRQERSHGLLLEDMARSGFGLLPRLAVVASVAAVDRFAKPLEVWDELAGGETLPGDGWSVVVRSTPGHTPGSLTFSIPEAGVVFTGDTVLKEITPNAVVDEDPEEAGRPFRSVTRYFETLDELGRTSGGATLLTGHGAPVTDWSRHRRTLDRRHGIRVGQIERELAKGPAAVRDLVSAIFPLVKTLEIFLAYSEILGFLMYLEDMGRVAKLVEETRDRYRLASTN
ncbi:MAG TPA: MBL fold metallo-hydrolase [Thermoanaerobaculia bacterium]|nr:MBL fold metallo-hydrolase [Thermoanaerobaculia bacterium]